MSGLTFYRAHAPTLFDRFIKPKPKRWSRRSFVVATCDFIAEDLDWDTVNAGSLDYYASEARTLDGTPVVIAVLDDGDVLEDVLTDAEAVRSEYPEWASAPLWLYVPPSLDLSGVDAVVRRVPPAR